MEPSYIVQERRERVQQAIQQILADGSNEPLDPEVRDVMAKDMTRMLERRLGQAFNDQLTPQAKERLASVFAQGGQRPFELVLVDYFCFAPPRYDAVLDPALKDLRAQFIKS